MPHRTAIVLAIGTALAMAGMPACADPALDYGIGASLEHSDNINYSSTDPISQTVLVPRLAFSLDQQGSTLGANVAGTLEYRDYLGSAFGNEFRTQLAGVANWHISPERLDWYFADNIGRQPIDAFQSNAPSNQQQTNVFSTGPTLRAKFSDVLHGQLDLRYTNSYADTSSDFNSNRYGALGTLLYQLDPNNALSGAVTASRTRYTESVSKPFDYDREDVYLGYQRSLRELTLDAAVGYSWLDVRGSGSQSDPLFRGSLRWNPSAATSLGINVDREYSDSSQDLVFTPQQLANSGIGSGINGQVIAPEVYVESRVGLDISHRQDTFRIDFAPFWRKLDYLEDTSMNQRSTGFLVNAQYYLRPTLWLGFQAGQERRHYNTIARTDDDLAYNLSLNLQRTRHWLWSLIVEHQRRDSDVVDSSYTENSLTLTVTYRR